MTKETLDFLGSDPNYVNKDNVNHDNASRGSLKILCGDLAGSTVSMGHMEQIVIGSDPESCNLVIRERGISGKHCMITYNAVSGTYLVMDQSTNGTYFIRDEKHLRLPKNCAIELRKGTPVYLALEKNAFLLES